MRVTIFLVLMSCVLLSQGDSTREARELFAKGSNDKAVEILERLVKSAPGDADAHLLLGSAMAQEGKRTESIEHLTQAVRLRPDWAVAYNALGMGLSRFVEMKAAQQALESAVRLDPAFDTAHVNLALVLAQQGELQRALEQLDRAIQLQGAHSSAGYSYYLRGKIYSQQSDFEKASGELEQAVGLRPDLAEAWVSLGAARRVLLDRTGSLEAFKRAVHLNPRDGNSQYSLGFAYLQNHQPRQAVSHLKESLRLNPNDRSTLYTLQQALRQDGRLEEAQGLVNRMKELLDSSAESAVSGFAGVPLSNEGVEAERVGNIRLAIEKYRAALQLDPDHDGIRLNYGLALCRVGLWDDGISEIREVIRHNPDNADANRALYIALDQQRAASRVSGNSNKANQ